MEETREQRIERLTAEFRKLLEEKFPEKGSTMQQIEELTEEIGREIERRIEEDATQQEYRGYVGSTALCECGRLARYVRDYTKRLVSLHGERDITRAYYHCSHCKKGFCPLDGVLGLDGGNTTMAVRGKTARLAALVPFHRCSVELSHLCGIKISAKTVERLAELVGRRIGDEAATVEHEILNRFAQIPDLAPTRLYATMDGAMLSVDGAWKECKIGAVYETALDAAGKLNAIKTEHVSTLANSESFGDKLYCLAFRRGVEKAEEVVVVADGARWIWNQARDNFPGCVEIVDFYHAAEHLAEISRAWHGVDTPKQAQWLDERKADLLDGRHKRVMRSLRAWRPTDPEHVHLRRVNLAYFVRNKERMRYDAFRDRGLHIGSGVVESACKTLAQARLKQAGMRWTHDGAEAILQLRRMWVDAPDTNFAQYAAMAA